MSAENSVGGWRKATGQRPMPAPASVTVAIRMRRLWAAGLERARNAKKIRVAKISVSVSGIIYRKLAY